MFYERKSLKSPSTGIESVIERYVGKRPELIRIEAQLEILCDRIKKQTFSTINSTKDSLKVVKDITSDDINNSPENIKIQKEFKKLFQLKDVEIFWVKTAEPNAGTYVKTLQLIDKNYSVTKEGVDINPHMRVFINVNTGLVTHSNLTAGEVLAVILHEFGHNFYQSGFQILHSFNPFKPGSIIADIILKDVLELHIPMAKLINFPRALVGRFGLTKFFTVIEEILILQKLFSLPALSSFAKVFSHKNIVAKIKGANPMVVFSRYALERHADSFAVDYGYGPEQNRAGLKLTQRINNTAYNIPLFNIVKDLDDLIYDMTFQTLVGYPTEHSRQVLTLRRLKKAQKDPALPKGLRVELERQITEAEKFYENYMSFDNKENHKRIFTWTYRKMLDKAFGGIIDIREVISMMDGAYNEDWSDMK